METATTFEITKEWVLAGNAIFTISNGKGKHYTYKVKHKEAEGKFREAWFVSLLTEGENEDDGSYKYVCMLGADGIPKLTRGSKFNQYSEPYTVLAWGMGVIWNLHKLPEGYTIAHAGRCGRRGRLLTHPDGVNADGHRFGCGPECWQIIQEGRSSVRTS